MTTPIKSAASFAALQASLEAQKDITSDLAEKLNQLFELYTQSIETNRLMFASLSEANNQSIETNRLMFTSLSEANNKTQDIVSRALAEVTTGFTAINAGSKAARLERLFQNEQMVASNADIMVKLTEIAVKRQGKKVAMTTTIIGKDVERAYKKYTPYAILIMPSVLVDHFKGKQFFEVATLNPAHSGRVAVAIAANLAIFAKMKVLAKLLPPSSSNPAWCIKQLHFCFGLQNKDVACLLHILLADASVASFIDFVNSPAVTESIKADFLEKGFITIKIAMKTFLNSLLNNELSEKLELRYPLKFIKKTRGGEIITMPVMDCNGIPLIDHDSCTVNSQVFFMDIIEYLNREKNYEFELPIRRFTPVAAKWIEYEVGKKVPQYLVSDSEGQAAVIESQDSKN